MKFIFFILVLINSLSAISYDMVDTYRMFGIEEVKNKLEKEMLKKEYWEYHIKDIDVSYGYYESIRYLIICQKDKKDIEIYDVKIKKKLFSSDVFIGKKEGDKYKEGDMRTPIGAYSLTKKLTMVDPFYGPLAFVTNYPNLYDRTQGKTGHGIWIHGLPLNPNQKRDSFTKGCIALDNINIKYIDKTIDIKQTALLINHSDIRLTTKDEIASILSEIFKWRYQWQQNNIEQYLSFYSKEFKNSHHKNFNSFKHYKEKIFARGEKKDIKFFDINIIPYPHKDKTNLFKIEMREQYSTKYHKFNGSKTLYIELNSGKISILTEE